jgi:hypothetical protein
MKIMIINPSRVKGRAVVRTERYEHCDVGAIYPSINCLYLAAILEIALNNTVTRLINDHTRYQERDNLPTISWDCPLRVLQRVQLVYTCVE